MSKTNDDYNYETDTRTPCQYGSKCYQKNKAHLEKYKHLAKPKDAEKESTAKMESGSASFRQQKLNVFFKKATPRKEEEEKSKLVEQNNKPPTPKRSSDNEIKEPSSKKTKGEIQNVSDEIKEKLDLDNTEATTRQVSRGECSKVINKLFLVDMPEDFYSFWSFCQNLSPKNILGALESIDLKLVGPFDVLAGLMNEETVGNSSALRHWRYYYDPPEFQTVIKCNGSDLLHIGYFRDEPNSLPVFVASNCAAKDAIITPIGENLFGAVNWYIKQFEKSCTPFLKTKCNSIKSKLINWAEDHDFTLSANTENMRNRGKKVVSKTLHQAGIVVPYDKKTELGYRPLSETQSNLVKILKQIHESKTEEERRAYFSKLHEIVNWANIAMDEGDFGTCLELGIDLFSYGSHHLHKVLLQLLTSAYDLLGRQAFAKIIKEHLEDRKKGDDLSVLKTR